MGASTGQMRDRERLEPIWLVEVKTPAEVLHFSDRNVSFAAAETMGSNRGFELGGLGQWTNLMEGTFSATVLYDPAGAYEGGYYCQVENTRGSGGPIGILESDIFAIADEHRLHVLRAALDLQSAAQLSIYVHFYGDALGTLGLGSQQVLSVSSGAGWQGVEIGLCAAGGDYAFPLGTVAVKVEVWADAPSVGDTFRLDGFSFEAQKTLYEDYLEDLSGLGWELGRLDSMALNTSVALGFCNERFRGAGYLVEYTSWEGLEVTVKEAYMDDGSTPAGAATVFRGVLDEPRNIDLAGFECRLSTMLFQADRQWAQSTINTADWPNAHEDLGRHEPIIYGSDILVPALRVDWGARTTLKSKIDSAAATLELSDGSRFPGADFSVWLDDEQVHVATRVVNVCSGLTRGYGGTQPSPHRAGAEAWEHRGQYDSLLAGHPLYGIGDVYAEVSGRMLRVTDGVSAVVQNGRQLLRATQQIRVQALEDGLGVGDDIAVTVPGSMKRVIPDNAWGNVQNPQNSYDGNDGTWAGGTTVVNPQLTVEFPADGFGATERQYLWVKYACSTSAVAVSGGWSPATLPATAAAQSVRLQRTGGNWGDGVTFNISGSHNLVVYEVEKDVEYESASQKTGSALRTGGLVGTRAVERFHAVVSGYRDTEGDFGGLNTVIERPDHVIRHFLVKQLGFALSEIDGPSFTDAGTSYGAASYRYAFCIGRRIKPSEWLARMAFEARSTLGYDAGKWRLSFLPDSAPPAMRTIESGELAGAGAKFTFHGMPVTELRTRITGRYGRAYSRTGSGGQWLATHTLDSANQAAYGVRPLEVEFESMREACAHDAMGLMLRQREQPLLMVEFPVYWEHFDLKVGDTISIDNPLYNGKKFYVEAIRRLDRARMSVRARQWW